MKKYLSVLLCLVTSLSLANPVDSLENVLKTAQGEQKVKVLNELFRALLNNDPVRATGYAREAFVLAESIGDKRGMAAANNNLGVAYRSQGALDIALEHYLSALELYTAIDNAEGIATTKNNIANIYTIKRDYGQALKFLQESHLGFVTLGTPAQIIGSLNNLGNIHADLQQYDKALSFYEEAWDLTQKTGRITDEPLTNIGNLFVRQGNYQRAAEYYNRSLDIIRKEQDKLSEIHLLANLGELFVRAGQANQAQPYLDQAIPMAKEMQADVYLPQLFKTQAAALSLQGKHKEAYEAMLRYDDYRDRVYGEESSRRIAQMDVALKLREKEREIEMIESDRQVKTLKLRNNEFIITSVVLGLAAVVAIGNLVFAGKRRKRAV